MNTHPGSPNAMAGGTADHFQFAYAALRDLAAAYLSRERPDHTLQPTALVNEAFLKLQGKPAENWNSKTHFQVVAAGAMRQILVDHARRRASQKRGGNWQRISLSAAGLDDRDDLDFELLDTALCHLAERDERKSKVVELRFFGGLTFQEIAAELGITRKAAEGDWYFARAWLRRALSEVDA